MEIAIYGGTFDPPTRAHEAIVEACLDLQEFDEVWVMPSSARSDKAWGTCDADRLAMLGVMKAHRFGDDERLQVSDFEINLGEPTQTWRTAQMLAEAHPNDRFWYLFGADSYADMPSWQHGEAFRDQTDLLIIPRDGYAQPAAGARLRHLPLNPVDQTISSTKTRQAFAEQQAVDHLVSESVAAYIGARSLYGCVTMS